MNPNNTPIVRIDWEDIAMEDNWGPEDEGVGTKECYLLGHLLVDTPAYVIIGSAYDWQEGTWGTLHALPKLPPVITVLDLKEGDNEPSS